MNYPQPGALTKSVHQEPGSREKSPSPRHPARLVQLQPLSTHLLGSGDQRSICWTVPPGQDHLINLLTDRHFPRGPSVPQVPQVSYPQGPREKLGVEEAAVHERTRLIAEAHKRAARDGQAQRAEGSCTHRGSTSVRPSADPGKKRPG